MSDSRDASLSPARAGSPSRRQECRYVDNRQSFPVCSVTSVYPLTFVYPVPSACCSCPGVARTPAEDWQKAPDRKKRGGQPDPRQTPDGERGERVTWLSVQAQDGQGGGQEEPQREPHPGPAQQVQLALTSQFKLALTSSNQLYLALTRCNQL